MRTYTKLLLLIIVLLTKFTFTTECPIEGQIRSECASHPNCTVTCEDIGGPLPACPEICVVNGCECPLGMVVDEKRNACVPLDECIGK